MGNDKSKKITRKTEVEAADLEDSQVEDEIESIRPERQSVVQDIPQLSKEQHTCEISPSGIPTTEITPRGIPSTELDACFRYESPRSPRYSISPNSSLQDHQWSTDQSRGGSLNKDNISMVTKMIGSQWRNLGRQLSLEESEVDAIALDQNIYFNTEEKAHKVISTWQQRKSSRATIEVLAFSLEKVGRTDIAEKILSPGSVFAVSPTFPYQQGTDSIDQHALLKHIQIILQRDYMALQMRGLPWMKSIVLTLEEYYVNLEFKVDGAVSLQPMTIEEIFSSSEPNKNPSRILVEGGPGSGKTTLAAKLAYDWAKQQKYISCFDLVFLLPLRVFVESLDETLAKAASIQEKDKENFLKLVKADWVSVLFIFDGYDEASLQTETDMLPLIENRHHHSSYPNSTVIITSRPGNFTSNGKERMFLSNAECAPVFSRFIDKRVFVKGFNGEQQKTFVDKHMKKFPDIEKERVRLKLAKMVDKEFLTCPLFLLMLIVVFTSNDEVEKTETKTDLYKCVFNLVFRRYYSKIGVNSVDKLDLFSLKNSGEPDHIKLMTQFSQFALKAINKCNLIVSEQDMVDVYECDPRVLHLGFHNQYVSVTGFRECLLYEPVHKSLLEFASAYGLWLSYKVKKRFPSRDEIIKFRPGESSSLFFSFLIGLLGEDAGILFEIISSYAFEYSCKFEYLQHILLETELNSSILAPLTPFLPPEWNIISHPCKQINEETTFLTSPQHEAIVGWGVQQGKIRQIYWDLLQDTRLPTDMVVDTLVVDMKKVEDIGQLLDTVTRNSQWSLWHQTDHKLHCKHLWCSVRNIPHKSEPIMHSLLNFLQFIDFQLLSFDFSGSNAAEHHELAGPSNHELFPYICSALTSGEFKNLHLHAVTTDMCINTRQWINGINKLVNLERLEILEMHVASMSQEQLDSLMKNAAKSSNLRVVAFEADFSTEQEDDTLLTVNLAEVCSGGKKSWDSLSLSQLKVEIINATVHIQHLALTDCLITTSGNNLMCHCHVKSLHCSASLITDLRSHWPYQASLTELNLAVDYALIYRGLSSLTQKLQNLQILGLTMTPFQHKFSLPSHEWLSNALSHLPLKGFEIWKFSKNTNLAKDLLMGMSRCLEGALSPYASSETLHQFHSLNELASSTDRLHLQYVMISDTETEAGHSSANSLKLMKSCLQNECLQRLEMVFSKENRDPEHFQVGNIFSEYSLKHDFPQDEGFRVDHDLWGSRPDDSVCSKMKHGMSLTQKDRIAITHKQTIDSRTVKPPLQAFRRLTVPNVPRRTKLHID